MIGLIVRTLQTGEFKNVSKDIEIAKGKYQLVRTWKNLKRKLKR